MSKHFSDSVSRLAKLLRYPYGSHICSRRATMGRGGTMGVSRSIHEPPIIQTSISILIGFPSSNGPMKTMTSTYTRRRLGLRNEKEVKTRPVP